MSRHVVGPIGTYTVVAVSGCAEANAFLARTSGLDGPHITAYTNLICGLASDGVWTKFDVLYIFATQDATTANLNLVSTSYPATPINSPTFTVDLGYTGAGTNGLVKTGFIPSTATSPNFIRNSAHLSVWEVDEATTINGAAMGVSDGSGVAQLQPKFFFDGNAHFNINTLTDLSVTNASSKGFFLGNRNSSTTVQGYKNNSQIISSSSNNSVAVNTTEMYTVGENKSGVVTAAPVQFAMTSIGGSLSSTDVTNFYNRLRTYMTAVGVP